MLIVHFNLEAKIHTVDSNRSKILVSTTMKNKFFSWKIFSRFLWRVFDPVFSSGKFSGRSEQFEPAEDQAEDFPIISFLRLPSHDTTQAFHNLIGVWIFQFFAIWWAHAKLISVSELAIYGDCNIHICIWLSADTTFS